MRANDAPLIPSRGLLLCSVVGLLGQLGTSLHEFVERQGVADHDLILEHLGVVRRECFSPRPVGLDLQATFHRGEVVDDLAFDILSR